jgi:hypothetical protein
MAPVAVSGFFVSCFFFFCFLLLCVKAVLHFVAFAVQKKRRVINAAVLSFVRGEQCINRT